MITAIAAILSASLYVAARAYLLVPAKVKA